MMEVRLSTSVADDARSNEIYNAVWPDYAFANEDAQAFKQAMPDADDYLAVEDGALLGSAFAAIRPERPADAFGVITVLPEYRRRGAGSALYDAVSRWAAARSLDAIESFVDEDDRESLAFAEKRGFRAIERYERLVLDLTSAAEEAVAPPDGIEIVRWDGSDVSGRGIYEVAVEAYRDEPGGADSAIEDFEDWLEHDIRRLERSGGATFVAVADGEVVGYGQLNVTAARPGVAAHAYTGVKRSWRGRGVAGALKRAEIAWARANGLRQLATQNEERNAAMLRLNERLGYRPESSRLFMRGPLSGAA
jgi:GNAT superfamily N-acetyltransferase